MQSSVKGFNEELDAATVEQQREFYKYKCAELYEELGSEKAENERKETYITDLKKMYESFIKTVINCPSCRYTYNASDRIPIALTCGHIVCRVCVTKKDSWQIGNSYLPDCGSSTYRCPFRDKGKFSKNNFHKRINSPNRCVEGIPLEGERNQLQQLQPYMEDITRYRSFERGGRSGVVDFFGNIGAEFLPESSDELSKFKSIKKSKKSNKSKKSIKKSNKSNKSMKSIKKSKKSIKKSIKKSKV